MAKFFPISYTPDFLDKKEIIEERINFLKKRGFKHKATIRFLINSHQKKVFKLEALDRIDDKTLREKVHMKNNTENWIVFTARGDLFLNDDDIKYILGYK